MSSVTYKFGFYADGRLEIDETIKKKISSYVDNDSDNPLRYVNYETVVTDSTLDNKKYEVQVTARIKDDNQ
jgi:hypothetical protein